MSVKRILSLLIILALMPFASAEGSNTEITASMFEHIIDADYEYAVGLMNEEAKAAITPQALEEGWKSVIAQFGNVVSYEANPDQTGGDSASLTCRHENGTLLFTCVFDGDGLIKTFSIMPLKYGTQEALPLELPQGAVERDIKLYEGTEMQLDGFITLPENATFQTSVVIMVQGSGPSDRDETVGPNKPFRDIAYGLAQAGIASIRHDKMTYSHPELFNGNENCTVDFESVNPALEALRLAREMGYENVYLLGHSLGGMLAPYIMSESESGFKGGIIMAGSPRKFWEIMRDQSKAVINENGDINAADKELALSQMDSQVEKAQQVCAMPREEAILQEYSVMGMPAYYMWSVDSLDRASLPEKNALPLLILQGEADVQVGFDTDYEAWKQLLGGNGLFTLKSYPGLNHLFMPAHDDDKLSHIDEAYIEPSYVDEGVIKDICDWINKG